MRAVDYSKLTEIKCSKCKKIKHVSEFNKYADKTAPLTGWRYYAWCKVCSNEQSRKYGTENREKRNARLKNWRKNNPGAARENDVRKRYKKLYGLTKDQVDAMKENQKNKCFLCGREPPRLVIDHNHDTGEVRKLLCDRCNSLIGWIEVYVPIEKIKSYLKK